MMQYDNKTPVQIVVTLWLDEDADVQEVVSEMTYSFDHPKIFDTEIRDINTEI